MTQFMEDEWLNLRECCMGYGTDCPTDWHCPTYDVDADIGALEVLKAGVNTGLWGGKHDGKARYFDPEMSRSCWVCEEMVVVRQCWYCGGSICQGCTWRGGICTFCDYLNIRRQRDAESV